MRRYASAGVLGFAGRCMSGFVSCNPGRQRWAAAEVDALLAPPVPDSNEMKCFMQYAAYLES